MDGKSNEWRPGPTVCRCCLSEGCYKDISTEYFWMGKREVYAEMLSETFDLTVSYARSGTPNSHSRLICEPCISRLRDAADFKRQVKECEQTFLQCFNPASAVDIEIPMDITDKDSVKVEKVKQEKENSYDDDDFADAPEFLDDDDDLDDQPLMNLATKVPKKESVDVMDLLDNAKAVKRKASKTKSSPAKRKVKEVKPSASKTKPERKKKDNPVPLSVVRRNAEIIVKYCTVYPFRLPENTVMCVFCCEDYTDPSEFRKHMNAEHDTIKVKTVFSHCPYEGYLKVDCTELRCRQCNTPFDKIVDAAHHLNDAHDLKINFDVQLGVQPFKFENDKLLCGLCDKNFPCLRQLSRHMSSHYQNFTCEECGKSYPTKTSLQHHINFTHISAARICRRCKQTFGSLEAKREHVEKNSKCWSYHCSMCLQRFMKWSEKEEHLVKVHGQVKRTYSCPECALKFDTRYTYKNHFVTTHAALCFVCSFCGKKFSTKRLLEQHLVVHTGVKLFDCTVCFKSFPRKANLSQHMWIHNEVKRFECKPCNKKFNQRVSYKSHMKTHHPDVQIA
ncbi:zinc finger protein 652-A-like isoform X9 [Colias croceus]|uniref:zinc finger protein 652-A-like isoform X9 n=1 Tax=Colias crocea TaxID=72248 RepID=UPI001E280F29|nr:zinc finger protein 652-A-like isoform X9 [Colias croceus]